MLQSEAASELETDIIHTSAHHVVKKLIIFNILINIKIYFLMLLY